MVYPKTKAQADSAEKALPFETDGGETTERIEHLANLEKLFRAAHGLMSREPTLDKAAFEYLRRLRVKVRQAISAAATNQTNALPKEPPQWWDARKDRKESPLRFLIRTYAPWLQQEGAISRADIRKLDPALYNALYNWKISSEELDAAGLPTKKARNDQKLLVAGELRRPSRSLKVAELSPEERESLRLYEVARRRRKRRT